MAVLDYDRMLLVLKIDPRVPGPIPGFNFRGYRRVRMHESEGLQSLRRWIGQRQKGQADGGYRRVCHAAPFPVCAPHEHSAAARRSSDRSG